MSVSKFIFIIFFIIFTSCGQNHDLEDYGDITQSPGGINLTLPAEHVGGWARSQCLVCHNASLNIHRGKNSYIDVDELNRVIEKNGESKYCMKCHSPNGAN
ncbi:MAG: hypothetical protein A2Z20_04490 [Bdellovibrionales bacterium RBG_16_40_8]|nr:MAG: hypothetical protein A2Z20_04490 [Bdellovibrionales bacterium RBG_16_40_8]